MKQTFPLNSNRVSGAGVILGTFCVVLALYVPRISLNKFNSVGLCIFGFSTISLIACVKICIVFLLIASSNNVTNTHAH